MSARSWASSRGAGAERVLHRLGRQRLDAHDVEAGRLDADEAPCPRLEAAGQHEGVRAVRHGAGQLRLRRAQAGEALERAHVEHFVEEEGGRAAVAAARGHEEREQRVEGVAGPGRRVGRPAAEGRLAADGVVAALGCRRHALDVDVLRPLGAEVALDAAQPLGAAGAAAADDHGDRRALVARARPLEQLTIEEHGSRHGAGGRARRNEHGWPGVCGGRRDAGEGSKVSSCAR